MNEIIILASGSPRRRELLTQIGIPFKVIPALSEERTQSCDPEEICRSLATGKAEEVAKRIMDARAVYSAQETEIFRDSCDGETAESSLYGEIPREVASSRRVRIIGADTIVVLRREILGKPKDAEDAARMLTELSGCAHEVMTGVCVIDLCEGRRVSEASFSECTKVFVSGLTPQDIEDYIATGEPFDKAGAYGIQGVFARYIDVVGLPAGRLFREFLKE